MEKRGGTNQCWLLPQLLIPNTGGSQVHLIPLGFTLKVTAFHLNFKWDVYLSRVMGSCALRGSLSLPYPKKEGPRQSFFGRDTDCKIVLGHTEQVIWTTNEWTSNSGSSLIGREMAFPHRSAYSSTTTTTILRHVFPWHSPRILLLEVISVGT